MIIRRRGPAAAGYACAAAIRLGGALRAHFAFSEISARRLVRLDDANIAGVAGEVVATLDR